MTEKLQQTIKEELSQLTEDAQKVIASMDWLKIAEEIGKKFDLEDEEVEDLQLETLLVLIGAVDMQFYTINVENHVNTTSEKAKNISAEVSKNIFKPILEKLLGHPINEIEGSVSRANEQPKTDVVQTLDPRFNKLPENIQGVVEKSNYQTKLYEIARSHKLSVTQMGALDIVTTDLIIGSIHPEEFKKAVTKSLALSEEEATSLVNDINEKVFKSIRGQMMGIPSIEPKKPEIQTLKSDLETLKSHGIDIVPEKLEIDAPHPILAQKLSSSVQTPTVKNEYALKPTPVKTPEVKKVPPPTPKITTYGTKADPYREIPE